MPQFASGLVFGPWTLQDFLGEGGNAEVWSARGTSAETVALKILKSRKGDSEPYSRFRQEVMTLQRIVQQRGVLPVLDHDLPEEPSRQRRAWLAMPIARPLAGELRNCPLRDVVSAVASVAETLAALKRDHGIFHRDIKPANLYVWNSAPAISDFGLAAVPEGLDLTLSGRPLGPASFLPYEMLTDPAHADPGPADVYLLAKTLWVLSTDQRWPPPGEQSAANAATSVNEFRPHPLAPELDGLVERCTKHQPKDRPTIEELAADLRAWLHLDSRTPATTVDTSALWKAVRDSATDRLTEAQREAEEQQCVRATARRLQELLERLHAEIRQNFPAAEFNTRSRFVESSFKLGARDIAHEDIRATIISGPGRNPIRLILGVSVMIRADGKLHYRGLYHLGRTETMGGRVDEWMSEHAAARCGSIELEAGLSGLAEEMIEAFPGWLRKLKEELEARG